MEDLYEEHACEFKNESECEEELDEEKVDLQKAEYNHFDEEDEIHIYQ